MVAKIRLMPGHDPQWRLKADAAVKRYRELYSQDGETTPEQRRALLDARQAIDDALNARFRTTAEYRDFYLAKALAMLEAEGIDMRLPDLASDATVEEIDRVLHLVWAAVEVTNSETF